MDRGEAEAICNAGELDAACAAFALRRETLRQIDDYEGCANLVWEAQRGGEPVFLRVSFRPERTPALIQAELDFVLYLAEHGVRVARPLPSLNGALMEALSPPQAPLRAVCFERARGTRMPDRGYRYCEGRPMEEYYQHWGHILGQMHALAKGYAPPAGAPRRPSWPELHDIERQVETVIPERLGLVRRRIRELLAEIDALPRDRDTYGLIHGDFNDGNFTIDTDTGEITAFDFDDCCTFCFAYELACAWDGGIGWTLRRGLAERRAFMESYMAQVLAGYSMANALPAEALAQLSLFVRLVQVEELLYFVRYLESGDAEMQARLAYRIRCIEDEIPFMGFFDSIYSPEHPFRL